MLDKEFQYYLDNQEDLIKEYNGKCLVIKLDKVIGVYETEKQAYFETKKEHKLGSFLIQICSPGNDAYTQRFHSRGYFV